MENVKHVEQYKCNNCKAEVTFNPSSQAWECDYCFSSFTKEELDATQTITEVTGEPLPELEVYQCNNCGAELLVGDTTSATFCLYCKNPSVITSRFSGDFKPKTVLPFKITQEEAENIYYDWIKKKRFAPNDFKLQEEVEKIRGVYAPYWLFNCETDGTIDGKATRIKTWRSGDMRYTQTSHFNIYRRGSVSYDKVPVDASTKLNDDLMRKVEPFDYEQLTDFSTQYMSGFFAEKYDVDKDMAVVTMKSRVQHLINDKLRQDVNGYHSVNVRHQSSDVSNISQSYSLLPVYILNQKFNDKEYLFVINGQSGKIVGEIPLCKSQMIRFAVILYLILWILFVIGAVVL